MKVLLSAYACRPAAGSEAGVGWTWARLLAPEHDVWVMTSSVNQPAIESCADRPDVHWVFVPPVSATSYNSLGGWASHYLWQVAALRQARVMHRQVGFDLVQHATLATWRLPCLLWRLGVPLIWGPVGGGQASPPGFASVLGPPGRVREATRSIFQVVSRHDPLVRQTVNRSRVVIAANRPTHDLLSGMGRSDVRTMLEISISAPEWVPDRQRGAEGPLRLLWVGGFQPRKALPLLLRGLAIVAPEVGWHLDVVGGGSEGERWQRLTAALGLAARVTFVGTVPHTEIPGCFRRADAFVFTSVRDTSGTVLLEAMAAGLPIVALAWANTPEIVTDACGVLIPPDSPAQVSRELAQAVERLAASPGLRERLGAAARRRASEHFSPEAMAETMRGIYREAVEPRR